MRAVAIAMLVLTSSAAWADGTDVPGADPKARIAGNVLVWHDAQLVFDPAQPKRTVQAASLKERRRASVGLVAAMRVVGVRGELVEVEPSKDYACTHSTFEARELARVRLFVSRADLAPVVVKKFAKTFDDGTRIEIDPGMPIAPTDVEGVYVVSLAFEMLRVEIPASYIGYSYGAAPRERPDEPAVAPGTKRFRMHMDVTATVGGTPFTTRKDLFTPIAGAVEARGDKTLFPIEDRCGRAKVALPKDKVETFLEPEPGPGASTGMLGSLGGGAGEYLPASTPMFAGKHRVGTLVAERAPNTGSKCLDVYVSFDQPFLAGARSKGQRAKVNVCAPPSTKLVKREGLGLGGIGDLARLPVRKAKLAGHVLVGAEAKWFTDPTRTAKFVQLADPNPAPRTEMVDFAFAAKVIGTAGDFVEVEVLKSSDCASARIDVDLASVRLFVERVNLMPVLAKPFGKTFKNGSRVTLSPGVGVAPALDGYGISIDGEHVIVPIPDSSVAYSYAPVKVKPVPKDDGGVKTRYSVGTSVKLGDHEMTTQQSATRIVRRGESVLFPVVAPCIDALVVASKDAVTSNELGVGAVGSGVVAGKPIQERWFIPKGTPLLSAKGRAVAKAAAEIDVPKPAEGAKEVCFATELRVATVTNTRSFKVRSAGDRTLSLCVPVGQIKHSNPMPSRP